MSAYSSFQQWLSQGAPIRRTCSVINNFRPMTPQFEVCFLLIGLGGGDNIHVPHLLHRSTNLIVMHQTSLILGSICMTACCLKVLILQVSSQFKSKQLFHLKQKTVYRCKYPAFSPNVSVRSCGGGARPSSPT